MIKNLEYTPKRDKGIRKKKIDARKNKKNGIMSLAGKFKVKNPISADKIRDYIDYSDL